MTDTFEDIKKDLDPVEGYFHTYLDGIALTIRQLLRQKQISQKELSQISEVDEQTISAIMNKRPNITLHTIAKLSFALGSHVIYPQPDQPTDTETDDYEQTEIVAENNLEIDA